MNDAVKREEITSEEWQRRCAARYMERGGVLEHAAMDMARATWECVNEGVKPADVVGPEEAADDDMACWEDDGDEHR